MSSIDQMRNLLKEHVHQLITPNNHPTVFKQLCEFMAHHPTWTNKIHDIRRFKITTSKFDPNSLNLKILPSWTTKYIIVSWRKACHSTPTTIPDPHKQLQHAMRSAIRRQIYQFKKQYFKPTTCTKCQQISSRYEVDHVIPFSQLCDQFLNIQPHESLPSTFTWNRKTGQVIFCRKDKSFKLRWQRYHKKHASLQWLCKNCNIAKSNKCIIDPSIHTETLHQVHIDPSRNVNV
jgi:hypothetical protein